MATPRSPAARSESFPRPEPCARHSPVPPSTTPLGGERNQIGARCTSPEPHDATGPANPSRLSKALLFSLAHGALYVALLSFLVAVNPSAAPQACSTYSIGLDTTYATTWDGPYGGRADGEVFLARDTLIRSITVWRPVPPDTNRFGMKLWIVRADSTGQPNMAGILLSGPTLLIPAGDNVHPVEYTWTFDPPFALPSRGYFWFGVQPDPCEGFFNLLFNDQNAFKDGDNWRSRRVFPGDPCHLVRYPDHFADWDLIFRMEFCDSTFRPEPGPPDLPPRFVLRQNGPNPVSSNTTIRFDLPSPALIRLEIFDAQGRLVRTLANARFPAGFQSVEWDRRSGDGRSLGAGVYLYRIQAGTFHDQKKMVLLPN